VVSGLVVSQSCGPISAFYFLLSAFPLVHFPLSTFPSPAHHCAAFRHGRHKRTVTSRLAEKVEEAIARLTEYRTALITAATTGKIDVRNVSIPQPTA
jgi:uncharacterized BrkB/YihY/UPF0761 family membrane protein